MTQIDAQKLLHSIKCDNVTSFFLLTEDNQNPNIRFGRFPILSILYLYNSKKIIKKYQKQLGELKEFLVINEPFELYKKFRQIAGKSLRLYLDQTSIILPIEMLAISGRDFLVKKHFKNYFKSVDTEKNLQQIYAFSGQQIVVKNDNINISAKPITFWQKRLFAKFIAIFGSFSLVFAVFLTILSQIVGLGTTYSPTKIYTLTQFSNALNSQSTSIILRNDLIAKSSFTAQKYNGVIDGKNKTITFNFLPSESLIKTLNGTIKNLNIVLASGTISADKSLSIFVDTNNGTLQNVNIECADLSFNCSANDGENYFSYYAHINNGYIKNCSASIKGIFNSSGTGNIYASAIAGVNNGVISSCKTVEDSSLISTNVDISGIVALNNSSGEISSCQNNAKLSQQTSVQNWSPNVAGIVINNSGRITNCINYADLKAESTFAEEGSDFAVMVGGICSLNQSLISRSLNYGNIVALSDKSKIYAGGICAQAITVDKDNNIALSIGGCGVDCDIKVLSSGDKAYAFCGGITGYLVGSIQSCYSLVTFATSSNYVKYFEGMAIGMTYVTNIYMGTVALNITEFYGLQTDTVSKCLGSVYNSHTAQYDASSDLNSGWTGCTTESQLKQSGVYWNEN